MTIPSSTKTPATKTPASRSQAGTVLDLTTALPSELRRHTPAGVAEALTAELGEVSWLLVDSSVMAGDDEAMSLRMLLDRASAQGVRIALDLGWQPQQWGLAPGSPPTGEVLRRFRTLAEAAALIRADEREAAWFFQSSDPVAIHEALPQRPAVLIADRQGPLGWCLGGRSGRLTAVADAGEFLMQLLDGLCRRPQLLGGHGPGLEALADPAQLGDLLGRATTAHPRPVDVQERSGPGSDAGRNHHHWG
jgi:hypothetical protein